MFAQITYTVEIMHIAQLCKHSYLVNVCSSSVEALIWYIKKYKTAQRQFMSREYFTAT